MKAIKIICCLIVFIAFWYGLYFFVNRYGQNMFNRGYECRKAYLPSITEIQEQIGAEPDGILGPVTQVLWDEIKFNEYALRYMGNIAEITGNEAQE